MLQNEEEEARKAQLLQPSTPANHQPSDPARAGTPQTEKKINNRNRSRGRGRGGGGQSGTPRGTEHRDQGQQQQTPQQQQHVTELSTPRQPHLTSSLGAASPPGGRGLGEGTGTTGGSIEMHQRRRGRGRGGGRERGGAGRTESKDQQQCQAGEHEEGGHNTIPQTQGFMFPSCMQGGGVTARDASSPGGRRGFKRGGGGSMVGRGQIADSAGELGRGVFQGQQEGAGRSGIASRGRGEHRGTGGLVPSVDERGGRDPSKQAVPRGGRQQQMGRGKGRRDGASSRRAVEGVAHSFRSDNGSLLTVSGGVPMSMSYDGDGLLGSAAVGEQERKSALS